MFHFQQQRHQDPPTLGRSLQITVLQSIQMNHTVERVLHIQILIVFCCHTETQQF